MACMRVRHACVAMHTHASQTAAASTALLGAKHAWAVVFQTDAHPRAVPVPRSTPLLTSLQLNGSSKRLFNARLSYMQVGAR
jgi:hypothetical protein